MSGGWGRVFQVEVGLEEMPGANRAEQKCMDPSDAKSAGKGKRSLARRQDTPKR